MSNKKVELPSEKALNDMLEEYSGTPVEDDFIVNEDELIESLSHEIGLIKDDDVRQFVSSVLAKSGLFWTQPTPNITDRHPPDEFCIGGLVLHTKRVFRIARLLSTSYQLDDDEVDIVLAAALLHDTTKIVEFEPSIDPMFDSMHPYTVERLISQTFYIDQVEGQNDTTSSSLNLDHERVAQITRVIRCQMGPWSLVPETIPITGAEMVLHIADLMASKLAYILDGEEIREDRWRMEENKPKAKGKDTD